MKKVVKRTAALRDVRVLQPKKPRISEATVNLVSAIAVSLTVLPLAHAADEQGGSPTQSSPSAASTAPKSDQRILLAQAVTAPSGAEGGTEQGNVIPEIVVTGSRIARPDYASDSPIFSLGSGALDTSGSTTIEAKLNQMPQFSAGSTQFTPGVGGVATLNLRNLGSNRNLVLLDGRRIQPGDASFSQDINTIPQSVIENVDVITGGASAVYGSDALSGVVNFKLRHTFSGVEIHAQMGENQRQDGRNYTAGILAGGNFADDRGNAYFAIDYTKRDPVYQRDRYPYANGFAAGQQGFPFISYGYLKGGNGVSQTALDNYFHSVSPTYVSGSVTPGTPIAFNNDGTTLFNQAGSAIYNFPGSPNGNNVVQTSPLGQSVVYNNSFPQALSAGLERYTAFGHAEFKISEHVTAYAQGNLTSYTTDVPNGFPLADNYWAASIPVDATHPVPDALGTLLASRANPTAPWLYGSNLSFDSNINTHSNNKSFQLLTGLKGDIPTTDLKWEVSAQHGETDIIATEDQAAVEWTRYNQLITAPFYGQGFVNNGAVVCTSGIYPFGQKNSSAATNNPGAGTVTVGGHTFSQTVSNDCLNYLNQSPKNETTLSQDVVEATLAGGIVDLPAGKLAFAAGADYRRNTYRFDPDALYGGLPQGGANIIDTPNAVLGTGGATNVVEAYAELLIPIIKDLPFVESMSVDLAARHSNYSQAGSVWAYKGDGFWKVNRMVSLRGGYERAVRAPNVNELFGPQTGNGLFGGSDPCNTNSAAAYGNNAKNPNQAAVQALCRALIPASAPYDPNNYVGAGAGFTYTTGSTQGNADLKPETADTYTVGTVLQPSWALPLNAKMSLSLDYYNIKIDGAIATLNPIQSYQLCFNANGTSNSGFSAASPYCAGIQRAPTDGFPVNVQNFNENIGGIQTDGVDLQYELAFDGGPGTVGIRSVFSYLADFNEELYPGAPVVRYKGTTDGSTTAQGTPFTLYTWKLFTNFSYSIKAASVGLTWQHLPSIRDTSSITNVNTTTQGMPAYDVFALFGSYTFWDKLQIRGGIDNLFDKQPPQYGIKPGVPITGQTIPSYYDPLGRRFYLAAKVKF